MAENQKYSKVYKHTYGDEDHLFRYNFESALLELVYKPSAEELSMNLLDKRELESYNSTGYVVVDSCGLSKESWLSEDKEAYMDQMCEDISYEISSAVEEFRDIIEPPPEKNTYDVVFFPKGDPELEKSLSNMGFVYEESNNSFYKSVKTSTSPGKIAERLSKKFPRKEIKVSYCDADDETADEYIETYSNGKIINEDYILSDCNFGTRTAVYDYVIDRTEKFIKSLEEKDLPKKIISEAFSAMGKEYKKKLANDNGKSVPCH